MAEQQSANQTVARRRELSVRDKHSSLVRGTVLRKEISISDPSIKKLFVNSYAFTNSRLYLITQFAPNVIDSKVIDKAIETVENIITKDMRKIETQIQQSSHLLESNAIVLGEKHNPYRIECNVNSRLSNLYLRYFELCDNYTVHINTLWMEGIISENEKRKTFDMIRGGALRILSVCRETCGKIINILNDRYGDKRESTPVTKSDAKKAISKIAVKSEKNSENEDLLNNDDSEFDNDDNVIDLTSKSTSFNDNEIALQKRLLTAKSN